MSKAGVICQVKKLSSGLDSSFRYCVLKRLFSARRMARARFIFQLKSSQESFLGTKKG
jgi:hypothetical protein